MERSLIVSCINNSEDYTGYSDKVRRGTHVPLISESSSHTSNLEKMKMDRTRFENRGKRHTWNGHDGDAGAAKKRKTEEDSEQNRGAGKKCDGLQIVARNCKYYGRQDLAKAFSWPYSPRETELRQVSQVTEVCVMLQDHMLRNLLKLAFKLHCLFIIFH